MSDHSVRARTYGRVFDDIAAGYDRYRPAYPDELIDQACAAAGIGSSDPVLEVGCGSGQLTRSLARRGLRVTALEPGTNLMSLATQNLDGEGEVEFVNARFEDAWLPRGRFRAVFSASAFHWVDPEASWQRAADVLVPGGTLALVQYFGLADAPTKQDQDAALAAIRKVAPDIAASWPATGISTRRSPGSSGAAATSLRPGPGSAATTSGGTTPAACSAIFSRRSCRSLSSTLRRSSALSSARCRFTPGSHRASAKPWTGSTRRSISDSAGRYGPARSLFSSRPGAPRAPAEGGRRTHGIATRR